jgi:tRNA (guanine6-N2)-methyltransferase
MNLYATVIPGIEKIASAEIEAQVPGAQVLRRERGRVYFDLSGDLAPALTLRSIMNIFALAAERNEVPSDASGPACLRQWLAETDLDEEVALHRSIYGWDGLPRFRVSAERAGAHEYRSPEVEAAAGAGIKARYGWPVSMKQHDLEVLVRLQGSHAEVSVRLSPESLGRRRRMSHGPASLNSTVAYAMGVISDPQPGEVFVDPMCGAGTILLERAHFGKAVLLGGDRYAGALQMSRENLAADGVRAFLAQWDAARLPLAAESVDKIVCNMPWGRRIGSHSHNTWLYRQFIFELVRVLKPEGRAVLLALERRLLTHILERHTGVKLVRMRALALGGLEPAIYEVRRV